MIQSIKDTVIVSRRRLKGLSQYSYCPYCVNECKKNGQDYKEVLQPLMLQEKDEIQKIVGENKSDTPEYRHVYFEDWYCEKCKTVLDLEDFTDVYAVKSDGSRYNIKGKRTADENSKK